VPVRQVTATRYEFLSAAEAASRRAAVDDLYRRSYVERIARGDEFGQPEAFLRRFDSYVSNPSFTMIVATHTDSWVGQAWGWPLEARSRWWNGLETDSGPGFTREDGHRTFALSEIMVDQHHTGTGIAHALHDRLLADRTEERATLLVNPTNTRARAAYLRWGWTPVGTLRPAWPGASQLEVLIRPLARDQQAE
jgi:GNAT superfamily N-acetyltransferase